MTKPKTLTNYFCLAGVLAAIFYFLHDIIGAMNYPGYSWTSQAVSDLTATDAPSFVVANGFSSVYGIFSCLCSACLCILAQGIKRKPLKLGIYLFAIMNFVSAIGYSLFSLSSAGYDGSVQSFIHVYVVTILVVALSIISLVLIAVGALKDHRKMLGIFAIAAFIMMFFGAAGSANLPKEIFGIVERFSTYSAVIFTSILGLYGFSGKLQK